MYRTDKIRMMQNVIFKSTFMKSMLNNYSSSIRTLQRSTLSGDRDLSDTIKSFQFDIVPIKGF